MKAGRGSPFTDVNKDVGSAATIPSPSTAALPASHVPCAEAGGPLLPPFLEARTAEPTVAAESYLCRISLGC